MRKLVIVAATLAALVATPAAAGEKNDKKPTDSDQKVVCRSMDVIGRRIPDRVCKTRLEWQQEASDARGVMDNLGRNGSQRTSSSVVTPVLGQGPQ